MEREKAEVRSKMEQGEDSEEAGQDRAAELKTFEEDRHKVRRVLVQM